MNHGIEHEKKNMSSGEGTDMNIQIKAGRLLALVLTTLLMIALVPLGAPLAASGGISVEYTVESSWSTGFTASIQIDNGSSSPLTSWQMELDDLSGISSIWDAVVVSHQGNHYAIRHPDWQKDIAPGSSFKFGFVGSCNGFPATPTNCLVNGIPCEVNGEPSPGPVPEPEPDPTPEPEPDPQEPTSKVRFTKTSDWGSGYCADISITNTSGQTINGWKLSFELESNITALWNGKLSGGRPGYAVSNESWNGVIAPGATVQFGFTASYSGVFQAPRGFTLNGIPCDVEGEEPAPQPPPEPVPEPQPEPTPEPEPVPPPSYTKIVGYFTSWSVYGRDFHVSDIPAGMLTHVNYGFANISEDGTCMLGDPYADVEKFYPGDSWDAGSLRGNFHQLQLLKERNPHLRTLISVGGWTWSSRFPGVVGTRESRERFAASCVEFVCKYGFDGVDIDWEYPSGDTQKKDFTLLIGELKRQLDARGQADGRNYLLTIAAPAGRSLYGNIELDVIDEYIDWINIMTYDFHGGWDSMTNFNSPLYADSGDPSPWWSREELNVDATVRGYLASGVPAMKLVVGVPFYGRGWEGVPDINHGLFQQAGGVPQGTWEPGVFDYKDLKANYLGKGYTRYWSDDAGVPWLFSPEAGVMITYDDPQSIRAKADYIRDNRVGGAMIWELSCDDGSNDLIDSLYQGLCQ